MAYVYVIEKAIKARCAAWRDPEKRKIASDKQKATKRAKRPQLELF